MKGFRRKDIDYTAEARRFVDIQLSRYFRCSGISRFSGPAEEDAVMQMIRDAWVELRASGTLGGLSVRGRTAMYHTVIVCFPTFVADPGSCCIPVDFGGRFDSLSPSCRRRTAHLGHSGPDSGLQ